ncbi:MAG: hypothetical protein ACK56I_33225, partial [bacterium]
NAAAGFDLLVFEAHQHGLELFLVRRITATLGDDPLIALDGDGGLLLVFLDAELLDAVDVKIRQKELTRLGGAAAGAVEAGVALIALVIGRTDDGGEEHEEDDDLFHNSSLFSVLCSGLMQD